MRKNKKVDRYPLEEYIVISISELDKEYNSHDDMKAVGEDGAATFFSTVSHDLKRHVKIFCDYQLKDQVPLRIRGNSEYFYTIESRKKKYPILLYLYYLPFILIKKTLMSWISKYESKKKRINPKTERKGPAVFKRNDYTFIYAFLRHSLNTIDKICKWFDHFWYFKISGNLSYQDGVKGDKKNLNINLCDLEINNQKFDANVKFLLGSMVEPLVGKKFDIIVSNPPYIPNNEEVQSLVKDNEPNVALFGGEDGLDFYRIILRDAKLIMKEKVLIAFEHGYNKNQEIEDLAHLYFPTAKVVHKKDMQGRDRMSFIFVGDFNG